MKRTLLWSLVAMIALASCQDDFINDKHKPNDKIGYSVVTTEISSPYKARSGESVGTKQVEIDDLDGTVDGKQVYLHTITDMVMPMDIKSQKDGAQPQSRGAVVTVDNIEEIGVTSIVWNDETWAATSIAKKLYMDDVLCEESNGFQTYFYWPAAENSIRFFAYQPWGAVTIDETDKTNPKIEWQVPATVTEQHDLLVASANYPGNYKSKATLNFTHALTGVQFKLAAGLSGVKVNKVEIEGVYYKGVYTYDYDASTVTTTDDDVVLYSDGGKWEVNTNATTKFEVAGPTTESDGKQMTINDGENTFMMMPQDLPDGAKINVYITDANGSETLTASLQGKTWSKGTLVTYVITFNSYSEEYILEFVDSEDNVIGSTMNMRQYPYSGGVGEYYIRSYKKTTPRSGAPTYEPIAWSLTSQKGSDYITGESGLGSTMENGTLTKEGPFKFGVLPGTLSSPSHNEMKVLNVLGSKENPIDLSCIDLKTGETVSRHTANCYVVRAPGYYKIPVVYGNAIKDGNVNSSAYESSCTQENMSKTATRYKITSTNPTAIQKAENGTATLNYKVLMNFLDHANGEANASDGNIIQGPWIEDQNYSGYNYHPNTAEVVWQDVAGLLGDVKVQEFEENGQKRHFVVFKVDSETMCEGNAVVGVKNDAGHIMWSWHIWTTFRGANQNPKKITNRRVLGNYDVNDPSKWLCEENDFLLAQYQLGFCGGETRTYTARSENDCGIVFSQVDGDGNLILLGDSQNLTSVDAKINFSVAGGQVVTYNNVPVYQWGRKDPLLPANDNNNDKKWYNNARIEQSEIKVSLDSRKNISLTIQNPAKFMLNTNSYSVGTNAVVKHWCKNLYSNLWNANNDKITMFSYHYEINPADFHNQFNDVVNIPMVKTVYDPCPAGYEVPRIDAFTGVTIDGVKVKNYYTQVNGVLTGYDERANVLHTRVGTGQNGETTFNFAFHVHPKHRDKTSHVAGACDDGYWTLGLGHRNGNGVWAQYAVYGGFLTSGLTCVQWIIDNATTLDDNNKIENFDLNSSRFAFMRNTSTNNGSYGTVRPVSGSDLTLAFPIIPVKTGANPSKTEVSVSGNINGWIENDDDRIDITL